MDKMFSLWRAYLTVIDMLQCRKFTVDPWYDSDANEDPIKPTYEDFSSYYEDNHIAARKDLTTTYSSKNKTIAVIWHEVADIGNSSVKNITTKMDELGVNHAIVIVQGKITSYALSAIRNYKIIGTFIETFYEDHIQINITKHTLVPKHILCGPTKRDQVFKDYATSKKEMPTISVTDPVIRLLGGTKNQLVKIVRESDTMPFIMIDNEKRIFYEITYAIII